MARARVIPCLLLRNHGLVKTRKFKDAVYLGDPVNAVRIFNEKEVDELVLLDIDASKEAREPDYELIAEIAGECFMPIAYGGGVRTFDQARRLIRCGVEKIVINSAVFESYGLIEEISQTFGSQAVIGAIDIKKTLLGGYRVVAKSASVEIRTSLDEHVQNLVAAGVGEIFLNSVDRDGTMEGYDLALIRRVTTKISVPLIACGGAGSVQDLYSAVHDGGASAVAAGSMFVFHGKLRAVLISYPQDLELLCKINDSQIE